MLDFQEKRDESDSESTVCKSPESLFDVLSLPVCNDRSVGKASELQGGLVPLAPTPARPSVNIVQFSKRPFHERGHVPSKRRENTKAIPK